MRRKLGGGQPLIVNMNYLDLFSGIGGMAIAAQWAGFELMGFSEIEPYCCKILALHWPGIKNYGDIRRADFSSLQGRIDVIGGGFPCQPFSAAGKRKGEGDDRNLWSAMRSVIEFVRPVWCICENVPGLLSMGEFDGICNDLEDLSYQFAVFNVPANSIGAKHLRYRVFIIANAAQRGIRQPGSGTRGSAIRGEAAVVAHAQREGCERRSDGRGAAARAGSSTQSPGTGDNTEALADADRAGLEELQSRNQGQFQTVIGSRGPRQLESGICRVADDVSPWPYPLVSGRVPNRAAKLKALGNAVVPAQAYPFFMAIAEATTDRWFLSD